MEILWAGAGAEEVAGRLGLAPGGEEFWGSAPGGIPLLLRRCDPSVFGACAVWHTSSAPFREALRELLRSGGLGWGPAGLTREGTFVHTRDESEFWEACGREAVPPECRDLPEALSVDLGALIAETDVRGAFHVHTEWSDGSASIGAMAEAAEALGWEWVGICDHSASATYAGGLSEGRLREQFREIRRMQGDHPGIRIFAGVESDILADGGLDYSAEVLDELDLAVASVHSRFGLDEDAQTARLVRAVENQATTVLGHPTGRLLLAREGYPHRWEEVLDAARRAGTSVELNAHPQRLDVDWRRIPALTAAGVPLAIGPDAHSPEGLADLSWGVTMARKGLARRDLVWNALRADEVGERLSERRHR